jgi:sugar lactone lactonase YvrE
MPNTTTPRAVIALLTLCFAAALHAQQATTAPEGAQSSGPAAGAQSSPAPEAGRSPPQDPGQLEAESRQAYEDGNYLRFYIANMKLHNRFPYVPQYMYNIVRACALLEKNNTAYHYMLKMQQQGLSYDFNATEDTLNIRKTQAYDYINNLMIEAGEPQGDGTVAMTLPGNPADYRAMAWDDSRDRLLVGTVSKGQVLAVGADGSTEVLIQADPENGLWSVNGLAVDPERKRLWISSAATPEFAAYTEADGNRNALFEFDLETLKPLVRYDLPPDGFYHVLGGVAVSGDGHVYVVDTVVPVIYRKTPQQASLQPFVASQELVAFTDVAVTPDNGRLFASDPVMGIFTVDLAAESAAMLSGPETLNLGGIQTVDYRDGSLFIVQAGIQPERLVRLSLDPNGLGVTDVVPMAVALEAFDRPGAGTVVEKDFLYFANLGAGDTDGGALVMRTRLDAGNALKKLDIQDLQEALQPREP